MIAGGLARAQDVPPEEIPISPFDSVTPAENCTEIPARDGAFSRVCTSGEGGVSLASALLAIAFLVALAVVAAYAGNDMRRRGHPGLLWTILVFLTGPIGVVFWLLMRRNFEVLPQKPAPPPSPYGPSVPRGSLPWNDWSSPTGE